MTTIDRLFWGAFGAVVVVAVGLLLGSATQSRAWLIQGGGCIGPGCISGYGAAPFYSAGRGYIAPPTRGTVAALLLDRFNSSSVYQDSCTVYVDLDNTLDLTTTTSCPGSQTVDAWGANRDPLGTEFVKINRWYNMGGGSVGAAVAVTQNNGGEIRFAWGADGLCYNASRSCAVGPTLGSAIVYRSENSYSPSTPLVVVAVAGQADGTKNSLYMQCGGDSMTTLGDENAVHRFNGTGGWEMSSSALVSVSTGALHAGVGRFLAGNSVVLKVDSSENTGTDAVETGGTRHVQILGHSGQGGNTQINEVACANFSSASVADTVLADMKTFYGTP